MKGLNLEQVEKVLNYSEWKCEIPGCEGKATRPGFKINPIDEKFVKDLWNELFGEIILDEKFVDIISNEKNTFRSCKKHRRELEINVEIDPDEAQNILESIYRAENAE